MNSGGEDRDLRTRDPIYLAMGRENVASLIEQYLWKIYEILRAVHRLILTKEPGEWEGFSNHTVLVSILICFEGQQIMGTSSAEEKCFFGS